MSDTPDDWTSEQNDVYRRVLAFMSRNPQAFVHPDAEPVPPIFWGTTCHNAAWFAAECAGQSGELTIIEDDETVFASEAGVVLQ